MDRIRVFLVEDQTLVRQSIRALLEHGGEIAVVGEAMDAEGALRDLETIGVDVVLMDIMLPGMDGIEATRRLTGKRRDLPIIMLTSFEGEYVGQAIEAGAKGYILKTSTSEQLIRAVRAAYEGQVPLDPSVAFELITSLRDLRKADRRLLLKDRQVEILKLAAQGMSYKEISGTLFVSLTTVKREMRDIFNRLGVKNVAQATSEAVKNRLI